MIHSKKLIAVLTAGILMSAALIMTGCSGQEASSSSSAADSSSAAVEEEPEMMTVHLTMQEDVTSPEAPDSPLQFADEEIDVQAPFNATVLEVLQASGREVKTEGTGQDLQVIAIGGLENGDAGEGSHWEFTVNGDEIGSSPARYGMAEGDTLAWTFVK